MLVKGSVQGIASFLGESKLVENLDCFKNKIDLFYELENKGIRYYSCSDLTPPEMAFESCKKTLSDADLLPKDMMGDVTHNKFYSYTPDSLSNKKTTGTSIGDYESFKTFKTNEIYRMGVQFQHISGV